VDWDEDKQRQFIIKDNVSGGEWDWEMLANQWDVEQLEEWGLDIPAFDDLKELEAEEDDYEIPDEITTDIVLGDLFEIGEHRLLCGDSTDSDAVARLMNGEKADMVFTDPPYGIKVVRGKKVVGDKAFGNVGGGNVVKAKKYSEIIGDDTTDTAREFYNTCVSLGMENFIIWGGNYFTDFLSPSMCWIIWDKENTGNFADVEMAWTSFEKGAKLYKWQWNGMIRKGDKNIEEKTRVHPTQKPVGLFGDIFNDFKFNTCFDGFLGSGSTMVAAQQLQRKCYGMEMEPKYCQVIVDRMLKLNPSLEVKRNGEPYKTAE
jgi:DNA modification methylase